MSKRLNAVAKAIADQNGWASYSDAQKALNAADAVMFSDEAVERAAQSLGNLYEPWEASSSQMRETWRSDVRAVIAALKGDA